MSRIVLVRHGQASWGKKDYDKLSDLGHERARIAGRELAERNLQPTRVVSGSMRRQRDTAADLVAEAGWDTEVVADGAWDEYRTARSSRHTSRPIAR